MQHNFRQRLENALRLIRRKSSVTPSVGVITGSGLGDLLSEERGTLIPYADIPSFPRPSVEGHPGALLLNEKWAVCKGRFHVYETGSADDAVLPVFLLHAIGVRTLILTNAAGGIHPDFQVGDLVMIRDHINVAGINPLIGPHLAGFGPRFPNLSDCYSSALRSVVRERFPALKDGVYAWMPGPSYETPAEIRMLRFLGADVVGMSTVPEAIAAAFLGLETAAVSCITNRATEIKGSALSHAEVLAVGGEAARKLEPVVRELGSARNGA